MKILKSFFLCIILIFLFEYIVYADDIDSEELEDISPFIEVSSNIITEPSINSRAAIVYDRNSGLVLFEKNETKKRKMASTTKIMTAIIVIENSNLDDIVTVSSKAAGTGGSRLGLHTNDKITVKNLLYGLMLCSGNDAAVALAEHVGKDITGFANLMNSKANMVIIPMQDILHLNAKSRMNTPGTLIDTNWTWKLADFKDFEKKLDRFSEMIQISQR